MSHEKKIKEGKTPLEKTHYQSKFIAIKENRKKIKESFDKSREKSMKGKSDEIVEV